MKLATPEEHQHIERLTSCIEEKLSWGPVGEWSHSHFEELSTRIEKETNVALSTNTLKRVLGKIESDCSPSKTTKNTLAKFCGYESYFFFIQENILETENNQKANKEKSSKFFTKRTLLLGLILLFLMAIMAFFLFPQPVSDPHFSQVYEKGLVPFTQIFKYKVDPAMTDTIFFEEYDKGEISLSTKDSVFSWMHFIPGYREVEFRTKEKVLWESTYQVNTNGWLFIFPHGGLLPRKYIPLHKQNGYLHVNDSLLEEYKINLEEEEGWVNYFNMQDYGVYGKNFRLETSIKNPIKSGVQQCQDAIVKVECQNFNFIVHFTQAGCQKFAELTIGEDYYAGIQNDLTMLTLDFNQWQKITLETKNGKFRISNNNKLLLEKPYTGVPGTVSGLHYSFRGQGMVDYLHIYDENNREVYTDEF